jgi:hypothetical protein
MLKTIMQGTPAYMPVELQARKFLFKPLPPMDDQEVWNRPLKKRRLSDVNRFFYHFYHDLESVFWFTFEYLLTHLPSRVEPYTPSDLETINNYWSLFFKVTVKGNDQRQGCIRQTDISTAEWLVSISNFHDLVQHAVKPLHLSKVLLDKYVKLEQTLPSAATNWLWPETRFSADPYDKFKEMIDGALEKEEEPGNASADVINVRKLFKECR